jgi:5-methylcytosine-specific restriction endonuclease McrA
MPTRPPAFAWHQRPMGIPRLERQRDGFYATREWRTLREQALERDDHACTRVINATRCGKPARTVHHIVERSQGGTDELSNLASICYACHNAVHGDIKGGYRTAR